MEVWIDQDLCTGDGLCEEIAPAVFELAQDGLAYVKKGEIVTDKQGNPIHQTAESTVLVPPDLEEAVQEASDECPGECIFIEH